MSSYKVIKISEVETICRIKRGLIYKLIKTGDFPKQINLSKGSVGWVESEVNAWVEQKMQNRKTI